MLQYFAESINYTLQNVYLRNFIFILSGVFMGYTLQPVPVWLNHLFNTSHILKFIILFISCLSVFYPMDEKEMAITFVCCILVLIVFYILRKEMTEKKMHKLLNIKEEKKN
jgi:hypothetical protein